VKQQTIEQAINGHEARNAALLRVFQEKGADLAEPRSIDSHFWTWSRSDAESLAADLVCKGFKIIKMQLCGTKDDPNVWNVAAEIRQSINLTIRREFVDEMVRLASSHRGVYDGWGTTV